ncbi:GmrSD restriction endonuclease domain-containing protein [Sinorhizobium meliloti]|uniref:GmrSD restriction endonuclease domain-containing protein n=1 Tax=Rhizobium meliloti TaxID=382 RepID=UPI000FD85A99|nr:DUF262 domain-containing protein [Sinorhizobium meliloti]RVP94281.1 DUF262 domain-containing protein [Sinorhizobium meliloti]
MPLFTTTNYPINALIEDIDLGKIGLPELQRPFVWPNVNVRNLFDSLYRGYPAGFLLFWKTGAEGATLRGIGAGNEKAVPETAIVDGQQRLTSLYAVVKGAEVLRANFKKERIRIAFSPLSEKFEVTDAAILKDKSFIPDISQLWKSETDLFSIANKYVEQLSAVRDLTPEQIKHAQSAISKLHNLLSYQFVALTLASSVDAETIAEVFVRINGEGKKLNQADFIMTLMSVFWDKGRTELEKFAQEATRPSDGQASSYNHFIKPAPDQMLRATIGLGLKRARLENVYAVLRGRDAVTGKDDPAKRDEQFSLLAKAQDQALSLANWHHFLSALKLAGYRSEKMISSQTVIIYSYVLYLIGVCDFAIDKGAMRQAVAEFFFMAALTGRYTTSPETRFESDLAQIRGIKTGEDYLGRLREMAGTVLTKDYWEISLPSALATSAARSPSLFAYQAALIKLDALALYSPIKITSLVDPAVRGTKSALEQHHLFPRGYLKTLDITETSQVNQIANFAPVEWPENVKIGAKPPAQYVPVLDAELGGKEREVMYFWHALPYLWWDLDYETFLRERRVRMARVVQRAWEELTSGAKSKAAPPALTIDQIILGGETDSVEFKSTLRTNLHTGQVDDKMQLSVLKTIAGFLNNNGGTLLIGVADDGEVLGLDADNFPNEDKYGLHLVNLIADRIGQIFLPYVHAHFKDQEDKRVLVVRCERGPKAAFVKDGALQRFYVRGGNATAELQGIAITDYVKKRFD